MKKEDEKLKVMELAKAKTLFLDKYLVPNFYEKAHLAESWSDDKWDDFKEFVNRWAHTGTMNDIMKELVDNFDKEWKEDTDDDEEEDDN